MLVIDPKLLLLHTIELMMFSILFGIGASWCWVLWNLLKRQPLLPEQPLVVRGETPWGSGSVLIVFVVYVAANLMLFQGYVLLTRRTTNNEPKPPTAAVAVEKPSSKESERAVVGSVEANGGAKSEQRPQSPVSTVEARQEDSEFSLLELMSIQAVVNTILIILLPVILGLTSGARLTDFGLSLDRWGRQVTIGVVAVLFLMPIIFGTQWSAFRLLGPFNEQFRHPVERMLREQFSGVAAGVAVLTAVVLAPVFEELMFRSIFQNWLIEFLDRFRTDRETSPIARFDAHERVIPPGDFEESTLDPKASGPFEPADWSELPSDLGAGLDGVSRKGPSHDWLAEDTAPALPKPKSSSPPLPSPISAAAGIVLTSLIFAGLHVGQWPAPIPIFVLALGLGLIYHRTGSLLAVICMHAVFNASSTLALIYALLIGAPELGQKNVPTPTFEQSAPVPKVNARSSGCRSAAPLRQNFDSLHFFLDEWWSWCYISMVVRMSLERDAIEFANQAISFGE